jgi:hypothetical protein
VAVLIAVLGTPHSPADALAAYQRASWVIAAIALASAVVGLVLLATRRQLVAAPTETGAAATPVAAPSESY